MSNSCGATGSLCSHIGSVGNEGTSTKALSIAISIRDFSEGFVVAAACRTSPPVWSRALSADAAIIGSPSYSDPRA